MVAGGSSSFLGVLYQCIGEMFSMQFEMHHSINIYFLPSRCLSFWKTLHREPS